MPFNGIDPIWFSLLPLAVFNVLLLGTLGYFSITYSRRQRHEDVDRKEHTHFLSSHLKEYWYWFIAPAERLCLWLRVTPNTLSVIGLIFCCISGYFFYEGRIGLGGWFMIFGATFDMFDGRIARITGQMSPYGAFFDSVIDRFSESVVFLGLAGLYRNTWVLYPVVIGLIGSMMVSYTRARGEGIGIVCSKGIMQRPERIVYLGVGSIFSPIFAYLLKPLHPLPYDFMTIGALVLIAALTPAGAVSRMRYILAEYKKGRGARGEGR